MIGVILLILNLVLIAVLSEYCGQRTALNFELIHYGARSRPGEWPWHVGLFHRMDGAAPSYACGGTIIATDFILTAAHCVYPSSQVRQLNPDEVLVRAGILHIQQLEHSLQQKTVLEILRHENHRTTVGESDIALLKLDGNLEFTNFVKPICLWKDSDAEELIVGKSGYVVGWGQDENGKISDQLKLVVMPIVSREQCRESDVNFYTRFLFDRKTFCAGNRNGTSPGAGDSGGGLYIEHNSRWTLRGITSKGKMVAITQRLDTESYVVFTDVAYFMPWIRKGMRLPQIEEVVSSVVDYATCGTKKELQFTRQGHREERLWPWEGQVHRSGDTSMMVSQVVVINENFVVSLGWVYSDEDIQDPLQLSVVFRSFEQGVERTLLRRKISRIIRHEDSLMYSIALLELTVPLKFFEHIKTICLWKADPAWTMISDLVGYTGELRLHLYDQNTCVESYGIDRSLLRNHSFCSTVPISTNATLQVYPNFVYVNYGGTWYLRGVAFNMVWSVSQYFFLLLDLAYYNNWIESNAVIETNNLLQLADQDCSETPNYSFSFQLRKNYEFQCYATLITATLLLTTASCVDHTSAQSLSLLSNSALVVRVRRVHLHPSYDRKQLTNNIAIVELYDPISDKPICLPRQLSINSNLQMKVLSWPARSAENSLNLSTVDVIQTSSESCADKWRLQGAQIQTNGGHICAYMISASSEKNFDCTSNLHGAPLVYESIDKTNLFLTGILDIGKNNHCDGSDLPEVYTDVMFYAEWISEIASGDALETTTETFATSTTATSTTTAEPPNTVQNAFFKGFLDFAARAVLPKPLKSFRRSG